MGTYSDFSWIKVRKRACFLEKSPAVDGMKKEKKAKVTITEGFVEALVLVFYVFYLI